MTVGVCSIYTFIDIVIEVFYSIIENTKLNKTNIKFENTKVWVKLVFGWKHVPKAHSYIWMGADNTQLTEIK